MNGTINNMEKIELRDNLFQYFFIKDDDGHTNSIYVCVDAARQKALVLDAAFQDCAAEVKKDLAAQGIVPEIVVLSHYHPDHAGGLTVFKDCRIYVSEYYRDNFENCQRWRPDLTFLRPTDLLKDGAALAFGGFNLKFIHAPGHSKCTLMTSINNDVLHIGDLLMFTADGQLTLPYISMGGSFKEHIESLERIKSTPCHILAFAHGHVLTDEKARAGALDDWLYYLNRVQDSMGTLPLAVCLKNDISTYANTEYHDNNLMYLLL